MQHDAPDNKQVACTTLNAYQSTRLLYLSAMCIDIRTASYTIKQEIRPINNMRACVNVCSLSMVSESNSLESSLSLCNIGYCTERWFALPRYHCSNRGCLLMEVIHTWMYLVKRCKVHLDDATFFYTPMHQQCMLFIFFSFLLMLQHELVIYK